jgi:hypothetical protein
MRVEAIPARKSLAWGCREFWLGVSEPSMTAFLSMLAGFATMLAVAAWFFSYATLAGPMGKYLARSTKDSEGFATQRALMLGATPATHPRLIILGSSVVANSLAEEEPIARGLIERTGQVWEVHMLTTPLQSPIDQLTLIQTALGEPGSIKEPVIIALGVSLLSEGWTAERLLAFDESARIGARSDWADAAIAELGGTPRSRSGYYIHDNIRFVAVNGNEALLRLLLNAPAARRLDTFAPKFSIPPEKRPRGMLARKAQQAAENGGPLFNLLRQLARHLEAYPNVRLVLIEGAVSPGFLRTMGLEGLEEESEMTFKSFADATGMAYLPIIREAHVPEAAYHDDLHIDDKEAQASVRDALVDDLAALVQEGLLK